MRGTETILLHANGHFHLAVVTGFLRVKFYIRYYIQGNTCYFLILFQKYKPHKSNTKIVPTQAGFFNQWLHVVPACSVLFALWKTSKTHAWIRKLWLYCNVHYRYLVHNFKVIISLRKIPILFFFKCTWLFYRVL